MPGCALLQHVAAIVSSEAETVCREQGHQGKGAKGFPGAGKGSALRSWAFAEVGEGLQEELCSKSQGAQRERSACILPNAGSEPPCLV